MRQKLFVFIRAHSFKGVALTDRHVIGQREKEREKEREAYPMRERLVCDCCVKILYRSVGEIKKALINVLARCAQSDEYLFEVRLA